MKVLQDTDTTLQTLKRAAEDDPSEGGYFLRDGLLFRRCMDSTRERCRDYGCGSTSSTTPVSRHSIESSSFYPLRRSLGER